MLSFRRRCGRSCRLNRRSWRRIWDADRRSVRSPMSEVCRPGRAARHGDRPDSRYRGLSSDARTSRASRRTPDGTTPSDRISHGHDLRADATITSGPRPGPWAGEVRRLVAGSEIETLLHPRRRDDPIAEHHTLGGRRVSALDPSLEGSSGPAVRRDGRDDRAGGRARGDTRPGPHGPRARCERTSGCAMKRSRSAWSSAASVCRRRGDERVWVGIFNRGTGRQGGGAAAGLRGGRGLRRRHYLPRRRPPPGRWTTRGPADSRPSRSMTNSGCSTARRSRRSSRWANSPSEGIDGTIRVLPVGALAQGRVSRRGSTPT